MTKKKLLSLFLLYCIKVAGFVQKITEKNIIPYLDCCAGKEDDGKLSGKTGGGVLRNNDYIMWLVGYFEKDNQPYFYALNFVSNDFNGTSQERYSITKNILKELKLIEP